MVMPIFRKILLSIVTLLLTGGLLATPAFAESNTSECSADTYEVTVSEELESALIEGATFAVDDFSRAQKGSSNERGGKYLGYSYYTGDTPDVAVALVFGSEILCYVPESAHALCDIEDKTSRCQLQAYFYALDVFSDKGNGSMSESDKWTFTSAPVTTFSGMVVTFAQEIDGKYYVGMNFSDWVYGMEEPDWTKYRPDRADMLSIVDPSAVDIKETPTGFAAFVQFLQGIDYSPLWVTLKTTGAAIVFIFTLGLAAAYFTLRIPKRAQDIFDTIFTIPMVLPPTVCGFLLLLGLGRNTALGQWFIDIGFPLIFSWPATVIAATVVAFPLMYRSCRGAFENLDPNMLDAARTLGWSNARIFFKLMIPLTWSSIAAATVLAFARALGEFGATLFLAGNYVGITRTIPIAIYFEWMSGNTDVAIFWTFIILVFSFAVILFINLWGRRTTKYRKRGEE